MNIYDDDTDDEPEDDELELPFPIKPRLKPIVLHPMKERMVQGFVMSTAKHYMQDKSVVTCMVGDDLLSAHVNHPESAIHFLILLGLELESQCTNEIGNWEIPDEFDFNKIFRQVANQIKDIYS